MANSLALIQEAAAYVPPCLVRQIVAGSPPTPGEIIPTKAAVLFADISGFTPMAEALARVGRRGAEEMTQNLNATFSATIACITAYGGDVAAFGGDAILAFFDRQTDETPETVAGRALSCAVEMRRAMKPFAHVETSAGPFGLRMKFGLSFGQIIVVNVGLAGRSLEFVIAGTPVDRAAKNENYAESNQIVADASLLDLLPDRATAEPVAPGVGRVVAVDPVPPQAPPPIDYARLTEAQRGAVLDAVAAYLHPHLFKDLVSKGHFIGDHRPVTSLFVNFAGLDYDDDSDVGGKLQSYVTQAQEIIRRYDGNLNRVLTGDKGSQLHILFGAPVAHEDDKARALRCALALQRELSRLPFIQAQRIGLASGYVFAGPVGAVEQQRVPADAPSAQAVARSEYTVMGDIVNLSARLTGVCPPGEIVVDAHTRSRTAQRFEFQDFGPVVLKGKAQPVAPYLLQGERPTENTLVTRYLLSQRPLVGRYDEKGHIQQAVITALEGRGQVLAVTGPAGVGKSRLIEVAVRRWLDADGIGYGGDCVSHGAEIPYWPWADLWRAQFDLHENDTPLERREKVLGFGQQMGVDLGEWAALVAGLLGLPSLPDGEEHPALAPLDAQARHLRLLELTANLVATQARQAPILLLFEDLHWADRASLELIDHVAARVADLPVLICLAYRPRADMSLACLEQPTCRLLNLGELSDQEGRALIHSMLGAVDLPAGFVGQIQVKAQGNPLFVEELVNGLVDAGLLQKEDGAYRVVGDLDRVQVPDTVEAVLLARIDRLEASARDVLRVASVVGRQFAYVLLQGIYPYRMSEAEMLDRLAGLERLDLTRLERPEPELEYLFKHALTREVAYANLSFALRRELHKRIGHFLEQQAGDHLETLYGTLVHHFAQGGQPAQALSYALVAGDQARALFANDEALAYYRQAENLLAQLSPQEYAEETLQLYLNRGEMHTLLGNFDEAEADLERGLAQARVQRNDRARAQALNGLAYLRYWQAHNEEMLRLALEALALAEAKSFQRETMVASHYVAMAHIELGNRDQAIEFLLSARALAEGMGDRQMLSRIHMGIAVAAFNQGRLQQALEALEGLLVIYQQSGDKDRAAACLSNIANTRYYLGDFEAARATYQDSITLHREIGKRAGLAYSLRDLGSLHCHRGNYAAGRTAIEEAIAIFAEMDEDSGLAYCELALGREYYLDNGANRQAEAAVRRALPVFRSTEAHEYVAEALLALGRLHLTQQAWAQAQDNLDEALALCRRFDLYWQLPEARLYRAELALAQEDTARAVDLARQTLVAIDDGGCPDLGAAAHLLLGCLAQDPLPHYERAIAAARRRSRRLYLAQTLTRVGDYLQSRDEATHQARGRAYLQEVQALLEKIKLSPEHQAGEAFWDSTWAQSGRRPL